MKMMDDDPTKAMVDLKLPKQKKGKGGGAMAVYEGVREEYPWGTRISFEKDQIDKMPELKDAEAGEMVKVYGMGKVVKVETADGMDNKMRRVEIQLHKVAVKCEPKKEMKEMPKPKVSMGKRGKMMYQAMGD